MKGPSNTDSIDMASTVTVTEITDADLETSILERFESVVAQVTPEHAAYCGADANLTYYQLDSLSDHWAAKLVKRLGHGRPGAQEAVVTLLPHGAISLIGLLAVLKTGHFYVPIEANVGDGYAAQILADCTPKVILTTSELLFQVQQWEGADTQTNLLTIDAAPFDFDPSFVRSHLSSQMIASVLYTSGSTGRPRGVIRTHSQNMLSAYLSICDGGYKPGTRVAHLYSYAHSFSNTVIFGAILTGATLYGASLTEMTASALYEWLQAQQIAALQCTPTLLRDLIGIADGLPPITTLISVATGMEPINRDTVQQVSRFLPAGCRLLFRLGSTEVGTVARFMIHVGEAWIGEWTPAGYPPPHTEVFIADNINHPTPPGEPGQICVRSRFLSTGYWNLPSDTTERFLPDPDGGDRRIFLTGDRGRMDADGLLYHMGRIDFMVKVRGYRVEPESIERALLTHPNLHECVVVARPSRGGDNLLITYLVVKEQPAPSVSALRDLLAKTLPSYMIPSRFIFLDKLPRNTNHKVDRSALPSPGRARPDLAAPFVAPRSELEQQIADIWSELLELDEVGIEDDFFDLGGDSILAMRMVLAVEQATGQSVPAWILQQPTVAQLAKSLTGAVQQEQDAQHGRTHPSSRGFAEQLSRLAPRRILRSLLRRGPVWRGHGLPYSLGIQFQQWFFAQPSAVLRTWLEATHQLDDESILLTRHLMANTWREWRQTALNDPEQWRKYVTISGGELLDHQRRQGRGIVLVVPHYADSMWVKRAVKQYDSDFDVFRGAGLLATSEQRTRLHAERLVNAHMVLKRGGVILIAIDSVRGRQGIEVPFYGFKMPFRSGAAELAASAGADLVFATWGMSLDGRMNIDFSKLPGSQGESYETTVSHLLTQYAAYMTTIWPALLPSISSGALFSNTVVLSRLAGFGEDHLPGADEAGTS